jgi:hypothetical protein
LSKLQKFKNSRRVLIRRHFYPKKTNTRATSSVFPHESKHLYSPQRSGLRKKRHPIIFFFFFFFILEFELRTLSLLGRCSSLEPNPQPFFL